MPGMNDKVATRTRTTLGLMKKSGAEGVFFIAHMPDGESWVSVVLSTKQGSLLGGIPKEVISHGDTTAGTVGWVEGALVFEPQNTVGKAKSRGAGKKPNALKKSFKELKNSKLKFLKSATIGSLSTDTGDEDQPPPPENITFSPEEEEMQALMNEIDEMSLEDINAIVSEREEISERLDSLNTLRDMLGRQEEDEKSDEPDEIIGRQRSDTIVPEISPEQQRQDELKQQLLDSPVNGEGYRESDMLKALGQFNELRLSRNSKSALEDLGVSRSQLKHLKNNPDSPRTPLQARLLQTFGTRQFDVMLKNAPQKAMMLEPFEKISKPTVKGGRLAHSGEEFDLKKMSTHEPLALGFSSRYLNIPRTEESREFEIHMVKEFSQENLDFMDSMFSTMNTEEEITIEHYRKLRVRYLDPNVPQEINVAYQTRKKLFDLLDDDGSNLTEIAKAFQNAFKDIFILIRDSMNRFARKSKDQRETELYEESKRAVKWHQEKEQWQAVKDSSDTNEKKRVRKTFTTYNPDNESNRPYMSAEEASVYVVSGNLKRMP